MHCTRLFALILLLSIVAAPAGGREPEKALEGLRITTTKAPVLFRSLGATGVYLDIRGTKGKTMKVEVPLDARHAVWFLPRSLRLAYWDEQKRMFKVLFDSRFDPKAYVMRAVIAADGVYTMFGLSRAQHIYHAQLRLCKLKALERAKTPFLPPDCTRILCPAIDYGQWSTEWARWTGQTFPPEDFREHFGNICDQCFGNGIGVIDYPECIIVDRVQVDPGDLIPPIIPCPDCARVCPDNDGDTVCNDYERCLRTDPNNPDTDGDGLDDGKELDVGTDPKDPDTDGDTLTDGDEVNTHLTDPLTKDTDGDGLEDDWEILGYDSDNNGTRDINLAAMGVDARRIDVLVEVDWMFSDLNSDGDTNDPGEISFRPQQAAITGVVNAFANAPVNNPDGSTGINLIVNMSNGIAEVNLNNNLFAVDASGNLVVDANGRYSFSQAFYNIKNANMTAGMANISRYSLWIRNFNPAGNSGVAENIVADDFVVSLGLFAVPGGTLRQQQGTFMHELGHTLGLYHGGTAVAGYDRNYEPNYPSIMNYFHQFPGSVGNWTYGNPPNCPAGTSRGRLCFTQGAGPVWTYSQGLLPDVDETNLSEPAGINVLVGPIDWNLDGDATDIGVTVDLQGDARTDVQTDNNDWVQLVFRFW